MLKPAAAIIACVLLIYYAYLREQAYGRYLDCLDANNPYNEDLMSWDPSQGIIKWKKSEVGIRYSKYREIAERICVDQEPSFPWIEW